MLPRDHFVSRLQIRLGKYKQTVYGMSFNMKKHTKDSVWVVCDMTCHNTRVTGRKEKKENLNISLNLRSLCSIENNWSKFNLMIEEKQTGRKVN
jgi:hypothetical protein